MFCTSCGIRNAADSNFCKQCGTRLEKSSATKIHPEDFDRALPDEEQVSALIERAYLRRKEGDLDAAISLCIEALHLPTESTSAHSLLGQLYEENGDHEAAIREYERVLALNPGSIADRVKLDELRTGAKPEQQNAKSGARPATRVVLSHDRRNRVFDLDRFTAVSVPLVLVLLGSAITLLWMQHNNSGATNTTPNGSTTGSGAPNTGQNSAVLSTGAGAGATKSQGAPTNGTSSMVATTAVAGTSPTGGVNSFPNNPLNNSLDPQNPQRSTSVPPVAAPNSNANIAIPDRNANRTANRTFTGSSRPNPGGTGNGQPDNRSKGNSGGGNSGGNENTKIVVDSSDSHIRIPVEGEDGRGAPTETPIAKVEVVKPTPGGVVTAKGRSSSASTEALTYITVGQDKKLQKDYAGAIDAFTKALASAGDQKGYVLQQRALCFQKRGDHSSARNDFASAIEEYRKLESTDPETAADGIRACQSGLKISGN